MLILYYKMADTLKPLYQIKTPLNPPLFLSLGVDWLQKKVSGSPSYFASILASLTDLKNSNSTLWQFILKFGSKFEPAGHVTIIPKAFSRILTAKSMAELYLQHFCSGRTSKGRLQVCRSRWLPHACLKKKYYHSCYTDLAQESKVLMLPKFWAETANFFPWEIISFLL